jgi:hypothetical protein
VGCVNLCLAAASNYLKGWYNRQRQLPWKARKISATKN